MTAEFFIAKRLSFNSSRTFSRLVVRIAIAAIAISIAVMLLSVAILKGYKSGIQDKVRGFTGDIQVLKYDLNASFENTSFIPLPQTLKQFRSDPDVKYFQPIATKPGIINTGKEVEGIVFKGVDSTYNWEFIKQYLVVGHVLDFKNPKVAQQILVSRYTANRLKLNVGDDFIMYFVQNPPRPRKFKIVGIYDIGVEELDKTFVIGDLSIVGRLNNWSNNEVGAYELRIKDFDNLKVVSDRIYDGLETQLRSYPVTESSPAIFDWLNMIDANTRVLLVLMVLVAIINMVSALLIMILERTNMIGILKALGASNWHIRKIFLYNAAYLIGLGLLIGNVLGLGLCLLQYSTHLFKLDQASYYMTYVPIQISALEVILVNVATLAICLLALLVPSMLVSRISPVKAISFK